MQNPPESHEISMFHHSKLIKFIMPITLAKCTYRPRRNICL